MVALSAMHAMAELIRPRFIRKTRRFARLKTNAPKNKIVCRFWDTTAPTKEGLLSDGKIVSNLHKQMKR
jgi:hypothetical protein